MPHLTKKSSFRSRAVFNWSRFPLLQHNIYIYPDWRHGTEMQTLAKGDWWMRQRQPTALPYASEFAFFRLV